METFTDLDPKVEFMDASLHCNCFGLDDAQLGRKNLADREDPFNWTAISSEFFRYPSSPLRLLFFPRPE